MAPLNGNALAHDGEWSVALTITRGCGSLGTPPSIVVDQASTPAVTILDVTLHGFFIQEIAQGTRSFNDPSFEGNYREPSVHEVGRAVNALVKQKEARGHAVVFVSTDAIPAGDTADGIQQFIADWYHAGDASRARQTVNAPTRRCRRGLVHISRDGGPGPMIVPAQCQGSF